MMQGKEVFPPGPCIAPRRRSYPQDSIADFGILVPPALDQNKPNSCSRSRYAHPMPIFTVKDEGLNRIHWAHSGVIRFIEVEGTLVS